MKKTLSIVLCLVLMLGLFAGCASKPADNTTPNTSAPADTKATEPADTKTTEPAATEPAGEPKYINDNASELTGTVRFYTAFAGANGTDALIEEFNKYYPNVKVEYEVYKNNGDGNVAADTSIMAGNVDVILSFGVSNTSDRWTNGLLMDITDRMAEDNLDLVKEWGTDTYKYEDRVYAFPSGGLSIYVAINKDKWDAAGLGEVPSAWTWDEYLDACRKMTEKGADGKTVVYGGSDFNQTDYWTYSIRQSKGMNAFYTADGNADFDNPLFAKILQREIDAENEGIWYSKANYLADSTKSRDMFLNGTNASTVESILTRYIVAGDPQFKITYAPYPVNEKGETNYMGGAIPNSFVCVTANTKNPDASYAFAKFLATYGSKYMYAAGHASTWTGVDTSDIVSVVFGSVDEAKKYIDVDAFGKYVVAAGEPAYSEDNITAFSDIQSLVNQYTKAALNGEVTVEEAMKEIQAGAQEAIDDAKK